jgi:hypothetical protein
MSPEAAITSQAMLSERSSALLERAHESVSAEQTNGYRDLIPAKRDLLHAYDALEIDEVLTICYWGRSGSRLLTSFLDSHDQVLMLPMEESQRIYEFLVVHSDLSLRDRLIAYPFYIDSYTPIFSGEFPIAPKQYFAAVDALIEVYRDQPSDLLSANRTFFQFLHIAYSLAINRCPSVRRPIIVYAQHRLNYHTARLVRDFPKARFIHTVRDPISCFDSTFAFYLKNAISKQEITHAEYPEAAVRTLIEMAGTDCSNRGTDARTRAVRFEDLHLRTEVTMRAVADWVGIAYRPSLLQSSFNGIPWVVSQRGTAWSGARPDQANRRSPNMWLSDRAMVYALFYENFVAWNYAHPTVLRHPTMRRLVAAVLWFIPTKIELLNASPPLKSKFLPALRRADIRSALQVLRGLLSCHIEFIKRVRAETHNRVSVVRPVLRTLEIPALSKAPQ